MSSRDKTRRPRRMDMLTTDGRRVVEPRTAAEASLIGRHWNMLGRVLAGDPFAPAELEEFEGRTAGGEIFETDLATIVVEGLRGELQPDSIYASDAERGQ